MMGKEIESEDQLLNESHDVLAEEGGIDSTTRIYKVNPSEWRKLKYMIHVDVEELLPLALRESQQAFLQQQLQTQSQPQKVAMQTQ